MSKRTVLAAAGALFVAGLMLLGLSQAGRPGLVCAEGDEASGYEDASGYVAEVDGAQCQTTMESFRAWDSWERQTPPLRLVAVVLMVAVLPVAVIGITRTADGSAGGLHHRGDHDGAGRRLDASAPDGRDLDGHDAGGRDREPMVVDTPTDEPVPADIEQWSHESTEAADSTAPDADKCDPVGVLNSWTDWSGSTPERPVD